MASVKRLFGPTSVDAGLARTAGKGQVDVQDVSNDFDVQSRGGEGGVVRTTHHHP